MQLDIFPKLEAREAEIILLILANVDQVQATLDILIDDSEIDKNKLEAAIKWLHKGFNALAKTATNKAVYLLPQKTFSE